MKGDAVHKVGYEESFENVHYLSEFKKYEKADARKNKQENKKM